MNDSANSDENYSYFQTPFQEQLTHLAVEVLLIVGMIWVILKRNSKPPNNLNEAEEEALISKYQPESLVPEVPSTHYALNQRVVQGKIGPKIYLQGVGRFNFASHDYLGLIGNKTIEENSKKCVDVYGVGSCGPRAFYGTSVLHLELERLLSEFLETEDSILFSYGFATIASSIPAFAKKNDIIFVDEKCNYAIQQGLRASKSEIKFFKHNDIQDLERILEETRISDLSDMSKARKSRRHLIVEGIYFNTGEICDLPNLIKLCKKYKLRIFIDESISIGVLGKTGRGVTEYFGVPRQDVDLIMGSLEFSFASIGGFCAGARFLVDHLLAAAVGYMFSASLPPLLVQAGIDALAELKSHPDRLEKLRTVSRLMHDKLAGSRVIKKHFQASGHRDSPIQVLVLRAHRGKREVAIDSILEYCSERNITLTRAAYLPDTDTAMTGPALRVTTNVHHTEDLVLYFICILEDACCNVFSKTYF